MHYKKYPKLDFVVCNKGQTNNTALAYDALPRRPRSRLVPRNQRYD
ncbi:hypothetical protein DSUL_20082 [Desulfovibrionales bacterium]